MHGQTFDWGINAFALANKFSAKQMGGTPYFDLSIERDGESPCVEQTLERALSGLAPIAVFGKHCYVSAEARVGK
jgi:hypothetical protein